MFISRLKQRKAAIATSAIAAMCAGSVAYAAIPDAGGNIATCYDKTNGAVRFIESSTYNTPCGTNENKLWLAQEGRRGPTGAQGAKGDKGDPGPSNVHWAKFDATGRMTASSDPNTTSYGSSTYALVAWPNVNMDNCAITVQAVGVTGDPAVTTYSNWYGYVWAKSQRITSAGPRDNGGVAFDITANCKPS